MSESPLQRQPPINRIERVNLPRPVITELRNGVRLYVTDTTTQPVIKLEVLIEASRWQEHRDSVGLATNVMWREGSTSMSGGEAAERIDYYGATLQGFNSHDHAGFTLYVLEKFLPQVLPLVMDLLINPTFPQKELNTFVNRFLAQLRINADKPDVQGYRLLTEAIFGRSHPYGYNSTEAGLTSITRADVQKHHALHFRGGNTRVFASGKISPESLEVLTEQFGRMPVGSSRPNDNRIAPIDDKTLHYALPSSMQSAVRLGKVFGKRNRADYAGMFVLNTILGGYFGSRLMSELRENRGLTYNIYSSLDTLLHSGYLYISTEVAAGKEEETLAAIKEELIRLIEDPTNEEELEMVRGYLMGTYLSTIDGPFNTSETIRHYIAEGISLTHFDRLVEVTKNITAGELQRLAEKYLQPDSFTQVIVGPEY